jgi:HupE / UreJ protein
MRRLALGCLLALSAGGAAAHEVRPALLVLREVAPERFDVEWRVPARGELRLALDVRLPDGCAPLAARSESVVAAMHVQRWSVRCAGGLGGRSVAIDGLAETQTDVLVRVMRADGGIQTTRALPSEPAFVVATAPDSFGVAATYLRLGVEHIATGADHLLFLLALLILVEGTRRLVATITAFTVAHSLTLAAATLGWVHVPPAPVEAVIALSIAFLAAEIVRAREGRPGLAARSPWLAAFAFGLLHGVGFAGALARLGLPEHAIPLALLFFNLGVELGQLLFVVALVGVIGALRRLPLARAPLAWLAPAYAIGAIAAYWTIARVASFWG